MTHRTSWPSSTGGHGVLQCEVDEILLKRRSFFVTSMHIRTWHGNNEWLTSANAFR